MDVYDSKIAKFVKWICRFDQPVFGITIGQTAYYNVSPSQVPQMMIKHENWHKRQWAEEGYFVFAVSYLWFCITVGYWNNPYEVEARRAERLS